MFPVFIQNAVSHKSFLNTVKNVRKIRHIDDYWKRKFAIIYILYLEFTSLI